MTWGWARRGKEEVIFISQRMAFPALAWSAFLQDILQGLEEMGVDEVFSAMVAFHGLRIHHFYYSSHPLSIPFMI